MIDSIIEDLKKRKLKITAFLCETEDKGLQILQYDSDGNARFLSYIAYNGLCVYANGEKGEMVGMGEIQNNDD